METTAHRSFGYKDLFSDGELFSLLSALFLLSLAYIAEHFANAYAFIYMSRPTSNSVGDLLLDTIPVVDLNFIIIDLALFSIVFAAWYVFSKPRYILFSLKALACFVIIRAFFISLTHVGIHPEMITPGLGLLDSVYAYLNFQTGLFFSGHTGLPFLFALIFWSIPRVRFLFFALSLLFGVAVLFGHAHYSIDVFAAPFMAYGIFALAKRFFPRDYALIRSGSY